MDIMTPTNWANPSPPGYRPLSMKLNAMAGRLTVAISLVLLAQSALAQSDLAQDKSPDNSGLPDLSKMTTRSSVRFRPTGLHEELALGRCPVFTSSLAR